MNNEIRGVIPETLYFRVRTVFLTAMGTTLTLDPVGWGYDDPDVLDSNGDPTWVECDPTDSEFAEPFATGGKTTELRLNDNWDDGSVAVGDLLTVTVTPTRTS